MWRTLRHNTGDEDAVSIGRTSAEFAMRDPDIRLMLRVREDDPAAFSELVAQFQHRLVGIMHHLVGNADEAEDLAQEVFLRVYRNRKKYSPTAKFSTWLFTIANNLALNALRNRGRKPIVPLNGSDSGPMGVRPEEQLAKANGETPSFGLRQAELADRIRAALDTLNERQRMAVVLNKFEDMNYAEVAEVMGLTPKAVKSLLSRARARLRDALAGYIYMDGDPVPADEDADPDNDTDE
ncbi:RNA polymerase sigma factor [Zavarzinella formosa]|uniref:RNA polymerase sigma factor n=1 Tax=Zavarzinella formosa TaxID=360055 RepID=UPI001EE67EE0|nr:sigma-70 family RNA polymerase sigma factor [Zavarzinella formosa]